MNSNNLSTLSILALAASALLIPVSAAAAGLAFMVAGVVAILVSDYGRPSDSFRVESGPAPYQVAARRKSGLRLAA